MKEIKTTLANLPTSVKGFCFHDDDGESYIVLNARLSWEQNRTSYDHEAEHIDHGDMYDGSYIEYREE